MALSDWFSRARSSSAPPDLRGSLIAAVTAKDLGTVARLFRDHRDSIRASFPDWITVPMHMKDDQAALATYGEMLITVARIFEQEGDDSLIASLRGDPADTPIEGWNRDIAAAQALANQGRHADAAAMLSALADSMKPIRGSAVDFYRPRVLGKLGVALFQSGNAERALEVTREARDFCEQIGDEEGVKAYTANLEAMGG